MYIHLLEEFARLTFCGHTWNSVVWEVLTMWVLQTKFWRWQDFKIVNSPPFYPSLFFLTITPSFAGVVVWGGRGRLRGGRRRLRRTAGLAAGRGRGEGGGGGLRGGLRTPALPLAGWGLGGGGYLRGRLLQRTAGLAAAGQG